MSLIQRDSSLTDVAFIVCTALDEVGVRAILSGGSAATVWAPTAYQSRDLDFIFHGIRSRAETEPVLLELGYRRVTDRYEHATNPLFLEFPPGPLAVGGDLVDRWSTLHRGARLLRLLTPTDSVRDRLAGFLFWSDRGSLHQAVVVARAQRSQVDLAEVEQWCRREGRQESFLEFAQALERKT